LSGSEDGIEYVLYRDGNELDTITGDGNAINFGPFSQEGTYYVEAESSNGCIYRMDNVVEVEVVADPDPGVLTATNDGHYCENDDGVEIILEINQVEGVRYELYDVNNEEVVDDSVGVAGGGDIQFTNNGSDYFDEETTYHVRAEVELGCEGYSNKIEVVTDPVPTQYDVVIFQEKCNDFDAIIGIEESETDVEYRWVNETGDSEWEEGTGDALEFNVLDTGTYTIEARRMDPAVQCTNEMGDVEIEERDMPATNLDVFEEGGSGCDDGVVIGIADPETDVTYQLFTEDNSGNRIYMDEQLIGSEDRDTIEFEPIVDVDATYGIEATTPYGCQDVLGDDVYVHIADAVERFAVTPDEADICNGDAGFVFGLEDSDSDVGYELYFADTGERIDSVAGKGSAIEFSPVGEEGEYYVMGRSPDDDACDNEMLNRVDLIVHPLPKSFNMIGPGMYCDGDGAELGVDNTEEGMTYILQQHTSGGKRIREEKATEEPGDTLRFDPVTGEDVYSVVAKSEYGCTSSMKDSLLVEQKDSPEAPDFAEDTMYYCSIEGGKENITPQNVENEVTYRVFDHNDELVHEVVAEDDDVELGPLVEGSYMVRASWEDGACSSSATDSLVIMESVMPIVGTPDITDNQVCADQTVQISYDISDDDESWEYSLFEKSLGEVLDQNDAIHRNDSLIWEVSDTVDTIDTYEYYIQIEAGGDACPSEVTPDVNITFNDPVDPPQIVQDTVRYCPEEDSGLIELDVTRDTDYAYYLFEAGNIDHDNPFDRIFADEDGGVFEVTEGEYVAKVRDINSGCYSEVSEVIFVEAYPEPAILSLKELIGEDQWSDSVTMNVDQVELELNSDLLEDNVDYYFYDEDGGKEYFDLNDDGSVVIDTVGTYQLFGSMNSGEANCLPVAMEDEITILEQKLIANDDSLFLPEDVLLDSVNVADNDVFFDIDDGMLDFSLIAGSEEDYTYSSVAGDFNIQANGLITYEKAPSFYGETTIDYVVQNNNFPERKDTATLYVYVGNKTLEDDKSIFIPNAFSPNDDGVNETFEIQVDNRSEAEESTLEVYNRWGTLVYRSKGNNYDNSWDGTANVSTMVSIGDKLPNGVYFYVYTIRANVEGKIINKKFNGYVELRR
ncbi:MAG: gliding motility-associated C-terminal domain-containing protein, partial [Marinilabiliaceae bacterium]